MSKSNATLPMIPRRALNVVADGVGARFFRNTGDESRLVLVDDGDLKPARLKDSGPAGKSPPERSTQETDEATFAKQLANELFRRAHSGDFAALVLIADPQTLGQLPFSLHRQVHSRIVSEIAKTLTKASIADIEAALH